LEPLLDRIAESWSNVVAPTIDVLDDETLRYSAIYAKDASVGGFGWNLLFSWHPIPEREQKRRKSIVAPVR
jgi:polypeptide N-acetylgalactosaminyltransferase